MPPSGVDPGSPADWLRHARSDLALASHSDTPGVMLETLCFHAQQAVEKALKAVLLHHSVPFPYTHDIARLITTCQDAGIAWPDELDEAAELTEYAVVTRYPGPSSEVTEEEYREAIDIAGKVFAWAAALIGEGS